MKNSNILSTISEINNTKSHSRMITFTFIIVHKGLNCNRISFTYPYHKFSVDFRHDIYKYSFSALKAAYSEIISDSFNVLKCKKTYSRKISEKKTIDFNYLTSFYCLDLLFKMWILTEQILRNECYNMGVMVVLNDQNLNDTVAIINSKKEINVISRAIEAGSVSCSMESGLLEVLLNSGIGFTMIHQ